MQTYQGKKKKETKKRENLKDVLLARKATFLQQKYRT